MAIFLFLRKHIYYPSAHGEDHTPSASNAQKTRNVFFNISSDLISGVQRNKHTHSLNEGNPASYSGFWAYELLKFRSYPTQQLRLSRLVQEHATELDYLKINMQGLQVHCSSLASHTIQSRGRKRLKGVACETRSNPAYLVFRVAKNDRLLLGSNLSVISSDVKGVACLLANS